MITERIQLRRPLMSDAVAFLTLAALSREFLKPWIDPPNSIERVEAYIRSRDGELNDGFIIIDRATSQIAGVINVNNIVRGVFQSAYLGYWIGEQFARLGYMTEAMPLAIANAFDAMKLHRLESNIQHENAASIALVKRCGFRLEGVSPRYLKIFGEWRDHQRWAITDAR